ncbi:hypothetical protein EIP91_009155 [Steccherinum ochraceum]|uniref:F-box domain-containing protein n=1 Tax=Steccherinum ochraceum TaxID=92696 RepID=A0A4R0R4A7_9APHY|nr:hypothetical protein EIP91_009155 [Steccherinum ochraceum]
MSLAPKLPIELLEMVVDTVDATWWWEPGFRQSTLQACSLVSQILLPRCRLHLHAALIVRSADQLAAFVVLLNRSPALRKRVFSITIDGSHGANQSWVSTVPLRLPLPMPSLRWVSLQNIDLALLHPDTYKAFRPFRSLPVVFDQRHV